MFDAGSIDAAAQYDVSINLKRVGAGWEDLSSGVGKFASMIDSVGDRIVGLGIGAAFTAGAAGVAAMTYGIFSLNNEAEKAAISIGTIFSVNGLASGVPQGITMAKDTIAQMRKDVQALPVQFSELQEVFKTAAIPMFQAGASIDQAEKLAVKASAAGAVMGLDQSMVAREFGMLLAGRAGSHNRFGTMLGFSGEKAKELNKDDPAKRMELVSAELNKYSGAIDAFKSSFQGMETTLIDNVKNFGRLATAPVFEEVKTTMGEINDWFTANQTAVASFETTLGLGIRDAFLWGKKEIEEWAPIVENFVSVAYDRMKDFWTSIEPYVSSFAGAIKDALSDPNGTIDKLKDLFELYAAVKIGGGLLSLGGAGMDLARGAGGMLGAFSKGSAAEQVVTRGAGLEYGELGLGAGEAGSVGAGAVGAGGAAVGAAFLVAIAAWTAAVTFGVQAYNEAHAQTQADRQARADANGREITAMINAGDSFDDISERIDFMSQPVDAAAWAMNDVAISAALAAASLDQISKDYNTAGDKRMDDMAGDAMAAAMLVNKFDKGGMAGSSAAAAADAKKSKPTMKGGHGGTSIQKVEIVLTSNQSPSRIARSIHGELAKLSNNRRTSPFVKNFSAHDED